MPAQPHPALRLAPACADVPGALVGVRPEPRAKDIVRLVCSVCHTRDTMEAVRRAASSCSLRAGGDMFQSQASSAAPGTPPPAHRDSCRLQA